MGFVMNILLLKLKKNRFYVRKNAFNYLNVDLFAVVNDDKVISYALPQYNYIYIVLKNTPSKKIRHIIGDKKLRDMNNEDRFILYCIKNQVRLNDFVKLNKKVNGLRYATNEECKSIVNSLVHDIVVRDKITFKDVLYGTEKYNNLYSWCMENDFEGSLFDLTKQGLLYPQYP